MIETAPKFLIIICTGAFALFSFAKYCLAVLGANMLSTFTSPLKAASIQLPLLGNADKDIERLPEKLPFFAATPNHVVVFLSNPKTKKLLATVFPTTFILSPFNCKIS